MWQRRRGRAVARDGCALLLPQRRLILRLLVAGQDYFLSSQFDVNKDGQIDDDERGELRKTMVEALVRKYRAVPKAEDKETSEMIKMFTRDLDKTVSKSTFIHDFNQLYSSECTPTPGLGCDCCRL